MARARKRKKGRAAEFFLLAAMALLIAGFIARREIPILLKQAGRSPAASAHADIGGFTGVEKLQPPVEPRIYAGGETSSAGSTRATSPSVDISKPANQKNRSGEDLSGAERRQLDNVIREKSR